MKHKAVAILLAAGNLVCAAEPVIWLSPNASNTLQLVERAWPVEAGKEIGGVKFYVDWLARTPETDLRRMVALVKERQLRVAVEVGGLLNHDWGDQIGERSAETELAKLRRWRDAGGRLDVLELDGAIRRAMGFDAWGQDPAKRFTDYTAIARELDEYLLLVAKEFPETKFHLLVNFPNWGWRGGPDFHARGPNRQNWGDYFAALSAVLPVTQATGPKFSVLTIDNPYGYATGKTDWLGRIEDLCAVARTNGLACALILNDEQGGKKSDQAFADGTLAYAKLVRERGLRFEHLIVQSWYPYPNEVVGDKLPAQMAVAAEVARLFREPASQWARLEQEILAVRTPPLRDVVTTRTIRVTDFGARPDDADDDGPAFRTAMAALCSNSAPTTLVIPPGTYRLQPTGAEMMALTITHARDVVVDGMGATIIVTDPTRGFLSVLQSQRVIVRGLTLDYEPVPFSQGLVTGVDAARATFTVRVADGFPSLDAPSMAHAPQNWGYFVNPVIPGRHKDRTAWHFSSDPVRRVGTNEFALTLLPPHRPQIAQVAVGDRYVQVGRYNGAAAFYSALSEDVTYDGITVFASPGGVFIGQRSSRVNILNSHVRIRAGRWQSTNSDAFHFQAHRVGPWIEGCTVAGVADDCVNLYATPLKVTGQLSPTSFQLDGQPHWWTNRLAVGDSLYAFDPRAGRVLATFRVQDFDLANGRLTADRPLPAWRTGTDKRDDHLYNDSTCSAFFVIRSNQFTNSRRYGLFLKAHHGLVEDNLFTGLASDALHVANEPEWPEGPHPHNLIIRRNEIRDCAFSAPNRNQSWRGAITIASRRFDAASTNATAAVRDILVAGNAIAAWQSVTVVVRDAINVVVTNNNLQSAGRPLVGAIRWDAWHGQGIAGQAVERTLTAAKYHDRLPFFATVATNGTVRFRNDAPGVMDREIDYARQAGLDFWAFVTYDVQHPGDPMGLGLRQYLASAHAGKPRFCLIVEIARWTNLTGYAELVRHEKYLRLADGRPVVFTLFSQNFDEADLRQRLADFRALVDPEPFIVGMIFHPPQAARNATALGLDAISTYAHPGGKPNGAPFAELTRQARRHWDASAKNGGPVVPLVSFGWDGRPRTDNPVPWVKNPVPDYFEAGTPAELADQMRQALDWMRDNPTASSPRLVLIYAWNEFDEGGWLCPTLSADGAPDTSRIEALGSVLRDHCREPGQADIPKSGGRGKLKQEKDR
jgi:hypothetical protein